MIASVDTYLRFAEATNRLDLYEKGGQPLTEALGDMQESGASKKTSGAISGVKKALKPGSSDDDEDRRPAKKSSSRRRRDRRCLRRQMPETEAPPAEGRYVYAVLPAAGAPTDPLTGIDGAPVEFVELGELAAATSVILLDRPPGRRHDLMAHSRLLESLAKSTTAVPVEFGAVLADRDSVVEDLLAPGEGYFVELIRRLEGTEQFNLRATYDESQVLAEVVQANPDIAELRRRTRELPEGALHPDLVRLGEEVSAALDHKRTEDTDGILALVDRRCWRCASGRRRGRPRVRRGPARRAYPSRGARRHARGPGRGRA